MKPKKKNCYTCQVRKENCGEARKLSPMDWTKHVCVLWWPRDMTLVALDKTEKKEKGEEV